MAQAAHGGGAVTVHRGVEEPCGCGDIGGDGLKVGLDDLSSLSNLNDSTP